MAGTCTGLGSVVSYAKTGSSSGSWTVLNKVVSTSLSGGSIAFVDITTLDSPAGYTEQCPDTKTAGSLSIVLNLTADSEDVIDDLYDAIGEMLAVKIEYPGGQVWSGSGYLAPPSFEVAVGAPVKYTFDFTLTGVATFTTA